MIIQDGDKESYAFASPEPLGRDEHDSNPHEYRYSRDACSAGICISYHYPKFLVLLPSLLLVSKSANRKVVKVSCLRLGLKFSNLYAVHHYTIFIRLCKLFSDFLLFSGHW